MEILILAALVAAGVFAVRHHLTTVAAVKAEAAKVSAAVKAELLALELDVKAKVGVATVTELEKAVEAGVLKLKAKL